MSATNTGTTAPEGAVEYTLKPRKGVEVPPEHAAEMVLWLGRLDTLPVPDRIVGNTRTILGEPGDQHTATMSLGFWDWLLAREPFRSDPIWEGLHVLRLNAGMQISQDMPGATLRAIWRKLNSKE